MCGSRGFLFWLTRPHVLKKGSFIMITTQLLSNKEHSLVLEDLQKLKGILILVHSGTVAGFDALHEDLKPFLESVNIEPNLREDLPDQIEVEVKFSMKFGSLLFPAPMEHSRFFYIECLAPDTEKITARKFIETVDVFMQEFCDFLYASADSIHTTLNP